MSLYKRVGAKYFFTLGNHHDIFDLWNNKHHKWNAVNLGAKKDIVGGWEKLLEPMICVLGIYIHSAHTWTWMETSQRSDKKGPKAGVPYDGNLTKADGKCKWWKGYDSQELYAQNHPLSEGSENTGTIHS